MLQSQGVVRVVGSAGHPEPIPDEEIESLKMLIRNSSHYVSYPYLREGMHVQVVRGPLEGVRGRLVREARHSRLVLSVALIQRSVAIEIDAAEVVPVQAFNEYSVANH